MALTREAYKTIEDIVGVENISEEPVVLDGYAFQTWAEITMGQGSKFIPRPEAVALPGSVEEVQAIVKACNRFKIRFKAFSTGWGAFGGCGSEGVVQLDLRRMNRLLEIDEKNKYAVVEPYVTNAMLFMETIKKGLRPHGAGNGPSGSVLASHTSMQGPGPTSISSGYSGRNLLGAEWVLPTGDVVRTGALGSGAGWFSGDGPGPSLRGIMRGMNGAMGGLGVFTKCAVKLYSWAGPPEQGSKGRPPIYEPEMPERFVLYFLNFPSYDQMFEATRLIGEAEIGFAQNKAMIHGIAGAMTRSNDEMWDLWQTGMLQEKLDHGMVLMTAAHTDGEKEYKEKCLKEILGRMGGKIVKELQENPLAVAANYVWMVWGEPQRGLFRPSGGFGGAHHLFSTIDVIKYELPFAFEEKKPFQEKGVLVEDCDNVWGLLYEHGTMGHHMDHTGSYDPHDPESVKGMVEFVALAHSGQVKRKTMETTFGDQGNKLMGTANSNFHLWLMKIKKAFDPNTAADPFMYTRSE